MPRIKFYIQSWLDNNYTQPFFSDEIHTGPIKRGTNVDYITFISGRISSAMAYHPIFYYGEKNGIIPNEISSYTEKMKYYQILKNKIEKIVWKIIKIEHDFSNYEHYRPDSILGHDYYPNDRLLECTIPYYIDDYFKKCFNPSPVYLYNPQSIYDVKYEIIFKKD